MPTRETSRLFTLSTGHFPELFGFGPTAFARPGYSFISPFPSYLLAGSAIGELLRNCSRPFLSCSMWKTGQVFLFLLGLITD